MQTQQSFDFSKTNEVKSIYNEFKDAFEEKLIVKDFLSVLDKSGLKDKCLILNEKLKKIKTPLIEEEEFSALFDFDLKKQENLNLLFDIIDTKRTGKISEDDLKQANDKYKLNLSAEDIKVMMTYTGGQNNQPVTRDVFKKLVLE